MTIQELAARRKPKNDAELSILGIDTNKAPSLATYPRHFNPEGFQLWGELLNSEGFAKLKKETESTTDVWYVVIRDFMKACSREGIFPFNHSTQTSNNDVARSFLNSSRMRVKKFFDHIELFNKVKIQKVARSYDFRASSFTVHNVATLRPFEDPTFEKWLIQIPQPRFTYQGNGVYHKTLQANIDLWIEIKNRNRVEVKYSIFCHTPVAIPEYGKLPTKSKLTQYAEKIIWLPVIRAHRFENIGGRLF